MSDFEKDFNAESVPELPANFDFLSAFKKWGSKISDVSDDFLEAAALFMIQTTVGRNYSLASQYTVPFSTNTKGPPQQYGPMYLNVPIMIFGKSRTGRKTWLTGKIEDAGMQLYPETFLPNSFSPEAMIDSLADKYNVNTESAVGILIEDDCGGFYDQMHKEHMASTLPILSSILSNRDFRRRTKGGGDVWVRNPYLAIWMNGTLDLPKKFSANWWEQGWANRFWYVYGQRKKGYHALGVDEEGKRLLVQCLTYLTKLHHAGNMFPVMVTNDVEVTKLRKKMTEELEDRIDNEELGNKESWVANRPEFIDKAAALRRLCHVSKEEFERIEKGRQSGIKVMMEDFAGYGVPWVDRCEGWVDRVLGKMEEPTSGKDETMERRIERVFNIIRRGGAEGIARSGATHKSHLLAKDFDACISTLLTAKRITQKEVATAGDTATFYRTVR